MTTWPDFIYYVHQGWNWLSDFLVKTWWFWSLPLVWGVLALVVVVSIVRGGRKR